MLYQLVLQNHVEGLKRTKWTFVPPATVGRDPSGKVCVDHDSVSRTHCQFYLNLDESLAIKDLDSKNGTYVDDRRIQTAVLMPGQIIQIGALMLQIEFSDEPERPSTSVPVYRKSSSDSTQRMEILRPPPKPVKKSWWQKLFG